MNDPKATFVGYVRHFLPFLWQNHREDVIQESMTIGTIQEIDEVANRMATSYGYRRLRKDGKRRWIKTPLTQTDLSGFEYERGQAYGRTKKKYREPKVTGLCTKGKHQKLEPGMCKQCKSEYNAEYYRLLKGVEKCGSSQTA